ERVPARFGPATLTPPPQLVARQSWAGGLPQPPRVARQTPRTIVLHQVGGDAVESALPYLRALAAYHTGVLGWDDIPYHFIVDREGTIFEGRVGGPTSAVPRLSGGDPAIHVALIGGSAPPSAQMAALEGLLAWLGQAYDIPPLGQHTATLGGSSVVVPNLVAHAELAPEASDPSQALRDLMPELRRRVDQSTVRSRWYFAEGNVFAFAERLAVLNPGVEAATVRFILLRQPGPALVREAAVGAGGRVDLVVNQVFSDTTDVPSIVEANAPVVAERFMTFGNDLTATPGVRQPSRVWYFAEGSTEASSRTFLVLFNPQSVEVGAAITYMRGDGSTASDAVRIAPFTRRVVVVADKLPGAGFGTRVIATQPIVAERTMIFGPGSTATTGGVHTAPGVSQLSRRWYFAEGTTQKPFRMSILVLNPNAQNTNVAVTFLTPDGTSLTRRYALPPTTRLAIDVNEVVPELGVATTVEADRPVAAERALYWREGAAGTAGAGAARPAYVWRFADGRTSGEFQQYLLLSNPNKSQARVTVDFLLANGAPASQSVVMPGGSRYTMAVHQLYPNQQAISATVRSTQPIVAERSVYQGAPGDAASRGGETALGVPE
ncbi:MAG TPA: peptidoglycan recognition family protein, partial [Roseiflexaceae bacterium]|nr:peptidoglycan recognition family protein [Roseiflexaceae bacterium]